MLILSNRSKPGSITSWCPVGPSGNVEWAIGIIIRDYIGILTIRSFILTEHQEDSLFCWAGRFPPDCKGGCIPRDS